jgi:hypothetical protein
MTAFLQSFHTGRQAQNCQKREPFHSFIFLLPYQSGVGSHIIKLTSGEKVNLLTCNRNNSQICTARFEIEKDEFVTIESYGYETVWYTGM